MKVPSKKTKPAANTLVEAHPLLGIVKISHTQGFKQSRSYQTADLSYSVELYVRNEDKEVQKGIKRVERIVEDALGAKMQQTSELLETLVANNSGN